MNPALTISGNTSVVWQVAVRDSANKIFLRFLDIRNIKSYIIYSPVNPEFCPVIDNFNWARLDDRGVFFEP